MRGGVKSCFFDVFVFRFWFWFRRTGWIGGGGGGGDGKAVNRMFYSEALLLLPLPPF